MEASEAGKAAVSGSPFVFTADERIRLSCLKCSCYLGEIAAKHEAVIELRINCKTRECKNVNVFYLKQDEAGRLAIEQKVEPKPMFIKGVAP
jgi:hypothetical protein